MPIYVYETLPTAAEAAPERFEVRQSMAEPPLTQHPESGVPVRRILSAGLVIVNSPQGGACGTPRAVSNGGCGSGNCCMN